MSAAARRQPEDAVGLVVHHRQGAVAGHGQHAVAHAVDHVAEEAVAHRRRGRLLCRRPSSGLRARGAPVTGTAPRRSEDLAWDGISGSGRLPGRPEDARAWPVGLHAARRGKAHARLEYGPPGRSFWRRTVSGGRIGDTLRRSPITKLTRNYSFVVEIASGSDVGRASSESAFSATSASISHWCISSPTCHISA